MPRAAVAAVRVGLLVGWAFSRRREVGLRVRPLLCTSPRRYARACRCWATASAALDRLGAGSPARPPLGGWPARRRARARRRRRLPPGVLGPGGASSASVDARSRQRLSGPLPPGRECRAQLRQVPAGSRAPPADAVRRVRHGALELLLGRCAAPRVGHPGESSPRRGLGVLVEERGGRLDDEPGASGPLCGSRPGVVRRSSAPVPTATAAAGSSWACSRTVAGGGRAGSASDEDDAVGQLGWAAISVGALVRPATASCR